MAGCFGNSPYDRYIESQLYEYLSACDNYEMMCEKLCEKIPDDLWDKYDNLVNKIIDNYLGRKIERGLITFDNAQYLLINYIKKHHETTFEKYNSRISAGLSF